MFRKIKKELVNISVKQLFFTNIFNSLYEKLDFLEFLKLNKKQNFPKINFYFGIVIYKRFTTMILLFVG